MNVRRSDIGSATTGINVLRSPSTRAYRRGPSRSDEITRAGEAEAAGDPSGRRGPTTKSPGTSGEETRRDVTVLGEWGSETKIRS